MSTKVENPHLFAGVCPQMRPALRPPSIPQPVNTFHRLADGQLIPADPLRRIHWGTRGLVSKLAENERRRDSIRVKPSRQQSLVERIEDALAAGKTIDGFLCIRRTGTGGIQAIPVKGRACVYSSVKCLAAAIDREMIRPVHPRF